MVEIEDLVVLMKTRIISAIVLLLIMVPIILAGGLIFDIGIYIISIFGLKEFLDIKEQKKALPFFVKIMCYILFTFVIFGTNINSNNILSIDFRIVSALFLVLLIPNILYHDKSIYSINDAFYLIGGVLFLSVAFSAIIVLRKMNLAILIYLALITVLTDTYAYFGGYFIGRHKLISEISPKKTWEGSLIGTSFCVFACTIFYKTVIDADISLSLIVAITFLLSVVSQFGDLVFSSIKRYFNKKDFSNLIPGHGGILDRLDSFIFATLCFMFIISLI